MRQKKIIKIIKIKTLIAGKQARVQDRLGWCADTLQAVGDWLPDRLLEDLFRLQVQVWTVRQESRLGCCTQTQNYQVGDRVARAAGVKAKGRWRRHQFLGWQLISRMARVSLWLSSPHDPPRKGSIMHVGCHGRKKN